MILSVYLFGVFCENAPHVTMEPIRRPALAPFQQDQILQKLLHYRTVLVRSGLLITRDFHASEDIYQNLVIKALNASLDFKSTSGLLAWCRTVVRTEAIDWLKKHGRELTLEDSQLLDLLDAESLDDIKESKNLTNWSELLDDCLKRLNSESQRLLKLRYDGNHDCSEVARMMEISTDSVYKRLSRIHLLLRDCVGSKVQGSLALGSFDHES